MRFRILDYYKIGFGIWLLSTWMVPAQQTGFYRIASTNATRIVELTRGGMLTWTSSLPSAISGVESASSADGPWVSDFPHIVMANTSLEKLALVPSGLPFSSTPIDYDNHILACVQDTVQIGTNVCRIEVYLWHDFMPTFPPSPPSGLLANIRVVETNGVAIPQSLAMMRVWLLSENETWVVTHPMPRDTWRPHILETTLRNGPLWEPGTFVDVILQVNHGHVQYLFKAADQQITAVW